MTRNLKEVILLSLMGPVMFVLGDLAFEILPNIHLVGVLTVVLTAVYRYKALIPVYMYVVLSGLFGGFALWWIPYLYIWAALWGAAMLVPRRLPVKWYIAALVGVCAAHGLLFGMLYAPAQALLFGLDWRGLLTWIVAGLPFDAIHGTSNLLLGTALIPPLYKLLQKLGNIKEL